MAMVVCPEIQAAEVGGAILAKGGNAADASVATAFAQAVVNPLMCSLSGTAILLHSDFRSSHSVINGEAAIGSGPVPRTWVETLTGRAEAIGRYKVPSEDNQIGPTSAMVPGMVAACHRLHQQSGSGLLSWRQLIDPSIRLAEHGFPIDAHLAGMWSGNRAVSTPAYPSVDDKFARDPVARAMFMKGGKDPYEIGDLFRQPVLAQTLDQLASAGAEDFYQGEISQAMGSDLEQRGSLVRTVDLENYEAVDQTPITGTFRNWSLVTTPPPSPGVQVLEMLAVVEQAGIDLERIEQPDGLDVVAQIMRAGFVDNRDIKSIPLERSQDWAERVMRPEGVAKWAQQIRSGQPVEGPQGLQMSTGTTHFVVVDSAGTGVSMTHSVGTKFGSGSVTPELGFLHNNFLGHFDPRPGHDMSIVAGRRIGSGLPTIARSDNGRKFIVGAPGGSRIITSIFQVLLEVLGRNTRTDEAVRKLRFHSEEGRLVHLEPGWPQDMADALGQLGNAVEWNTYQARVQAIGIEPDGTCTAGVDPRGGAYGTPDKAGPSPTGQ